MKLRHVKQISAILFLIASSSCANKENCGLNSKTPVTLMVWNAYEGVVKENFETLMDRFNQSKGAELGIHINYKNFPSLEQIEDDLRVAIDSQKEIPDICQANLETALYANNQKLLVNLNKYISKNELNDYVDSFIDEGYLLDHSNLKLFPISARGEVLIVNMTAFQMFQSFNPTYDTSYFATYEGLLEVSEAFYLWSNKAFFGCDAFENYLFSGSKQFGIDIFSYQSSSLNIDKVVFKKLWDAYYIPYIHGYYLEKEQTRLEDFKKGNIVAYIDSSSSFLSIPEHIHQQDIEIKIFPTPHFDTKKSVTIQDGDYMMVVKSSKTKEYAASLFLKWLTSPENNIPFAISAGSLPVHKDAFGMQKIDSQLQKENQTISSVFHSIIEQTISQINQKEMFYVPYPNENGLAIKQILRTSMPTIAKENRKKILNSLGHKEVIEVYSNDQIFEEWFSSFQNELNALQH